MKPDEQTLCLCFLELHQLLNECLCQPVANYCQTQTKAENELGLLKISAPRKSSEAAVPRCFSKWVVFLKILQYS